MSNSKNDIAWNQLFKKFDILNQVANEGVFKITSKAINEFREARLMTKFDHSSQLSEIFRNNGLSILPVSRGDYEIGPFKIFHPLAEQESSIENIMFPDFLESLNHLDITSEATAINSAFVARILHNFTHEDSLYPTVSGRMGSGTFSFEINSGNTNRKVYIENAQVEIDGGYEGDIGLHLIEAKNYLSGDFLVRQLYYPYRIWSEKIRKPVKLIFLTYSNGIFHLREFGFENALQYNSLQLVKEKRYRFHEHIFSLELLYQLLETTPTIPEPNIPFPQADSFARIINAMELIYLNNGITKEDYLNDYDFGAIDSRQHDYYTNAARYLGLADKMKDSSNGQVFFKLTSLGERIMHIPVAKRQIEFVKCILAHQVFKDALHAYFSHKQMPEKQEIVRIMKRSKLYKIDAETTYLRRASTISGWLRWIIELIPEIKP
jgi:hypothetical protein